MTQEDALSILKIGKNVFLTGEPGSGKTHVANLFIAWLRARGVEPAITASTGIAATHIGGLTVHSWSGIGIKERLTRQDLRKIVENRRVAERVRNAKVLIIDEISMLAAGTLEMIESVCRSVRSDGRPFGGLQVVLVGDFFQLPPVTKRLPPDVVQEEFFPLAGDPLSFAFNSPVWCELAPAVCYISEQHRQDDGEFLGVLSAIRKNSVGAVHRALLRTRIAASFPAKATKLFSRNVNVDNINNKELAGLSGETRSYPIESSGPKELVEHLKRGCLSPEILSLKVGARVMFTKNDPARRFINGTLGVVAGFSKENFLPIIKTDVGRTLTAATEEWHIEDGGNVLARIKQIPLRLAWAITIHKSQGMSLDAAYMDLSDTFEYGQGYVALSRVRSFSGLALRGFNERALEVHPEVRAKDVEFRNLSRKEEEKIKNISAEEQKEEQEKFIRACGGKTDLAQDSLPESVASDGDSFKQETVPTEKKIYSVEKIRVKYPNAYQLWSEKEDADLARRYKLGENVVVLAEALGRQRGSIRSRLIKLGLTEE